MKNTYLKIIWRNLANFCNAVTLSLIILLIAIGAWSYAVSSFILFINIGISLYQEIRAKIVVDKLILVTRSIYEVKRGGEELKVPTEEICAEDTVVLRVGQQVPADGKVLEGTLELDESILTGESSAVKKRAGDLVLAGSTVKAGRAAVRADKVGADCYIESVAKIAKTVLKPRSNIFKTLDKIIKVISIGLVPLAILLLVSNLISQGGVGFHQTVIDVSSSILGMIPIGMFLLVSTALAASVLKLSKKHTLLKDLYSIEMLASVDTLLLDKTGTMTSGALDVSGSKAFSEVTAGADGRVLERETGLAVESLLFTLLVAGESNNSTGKALEASARRLGRLLEMSRTLPFSSDRKYSAVELKNGLAYALGAPDFLAGASPEVLAYASENSRLCRRTVLLVRLDGGIDCIDTGRHVPVMGYALDDRLRGGAAETLAWFQKNGVDIKVVSGDECKTVGKTAERAGLLGAERCLNCAKISESQLEAAVEDTTVFGRTSPEQKAAIVKTLQKKRRIVGMIGDGVNDILALKQADCSISFACASESARDISRIVLLDSDFNSLPSIVKEGRRVIGNVQKVSSLFVMKNIFVMFMTFLFAALIFFYPNTQYPFDAKKMMLIELFVLGLPVFVLALDKNPQRPKGSIIEGHKKRNSLRAVVDCRRVGGIAFWKPQGLRSAVYGFVSVDNSYYERLRLYAYRGSASHQADAYNHYSNDIRVDRRSGFR